MCLHTTFFDGVSTPRFAVSFSLPLIDSSIDESQFAFVEPSIILLLKATFAWF
jgi:hypothetical protein